MCSRLGVFTGKGLAALIREEFSLRVAAFALVCLVVANVGLVVSEFAGIGAALELFGVSKYLSVPLSAVAIWALVLFGSYRYAERIFLVLSLVFLAYPVAADPRPPALGDRRGRHGDPPLSAVLALPAPRRGAHRHHHHAVHAALRRRRRGRQGHRPRGLPLRADRRRRRRHLRRHHQPVHHHRHGRRDRPPGAAQLGRGRGQPRSSRSRAASPAISSASACSAPRPWPAPSCRCRPPTPSPRRWAWSVRCHGGFREAPLFLGLFTGPGGHRVRGRPDHVQPGPPADHHPGAQRPDHAGDPGVHPGDGQPPVAARGRGQWPGLPVP